MVTGWLIPHITMWVLTFCSTSAGRRPPPAVPLLCINLSLSTCLYHCLSLSLSIPISINLSLSRRWHRGFGRRWRRGCFAWQARHLVTLCSPWTALDAVDTAAALCGSDLSCHPMHVSESSSFSLTSRCLPGKVYKWGKKFLFVCVIIWKYCNECSSIRHSFAFLCLKWENVFPKSQCYFWAGLVTLKFGVTMLVIILISTIWIFQLVPFLW